MSRRTRSNRVAQAEAQHNQSAPSEIQSEAAVVDDIKIHERSVPASSMDLESSAEVDQEMSNSVESDADRRRPRSLSIRDLTAVVQVLPKWSSNTIFEVFLRRLEVQLKSLDVPLSDWLRVLVLLFSIDIDAQEWIRTYVVEAGLSWTDSKPVLAAHFESADYQEDLKRQFKACRQSSSETVQRYGDRFRYLCKQLGYTDDNEVVINQFLQNLQPKLYADFLKFKSHMDMQHDGWSLPSLHEAVKLCIKLDVKNRTVQHAMSSSSSSSSSASSLSATSWLTLPSSTGQSINRHTSHVKRTRLFCKYHPQSTTHSTDQCRFPSLGSSASRWKFTSSTRQSGGMLRRPMAPGPAHGRNGPHTPTAAAGVNLSRASTSDITCYACGGKGHYANDSSCPKRRAAATLSPGPSGASVNVAASTSFNRPTAASTTSSSMMNVNNSARPQTFRPSIRALRRSHQGPPRANPASNSSSSEESFMITSSGMKPRNGSAAWADQPGISGLRGVKRSRSNHYQAAESNDP